jgi:hypothetical protein
MFTILRLPSKPTSAAGADVDSGVPRRLCHALQELAELFLFLSSFDETDLERSRPFEEKSVQLLRDLG